MRLPAPGVSAPAAEMVEAPASPIDRASAINSYLKAKNNVNTIDDLDGPAEEPLLELQSHHKLIFIVEMCQAVRPSKLGSLKGTHDKYEDELTKLQSTVADLAGAGAVEVIQWEPGMPVVPSSSSRPPPTGGGAGGARSRPQSAGVTGRSRPQSAGPNVPSWAPITREKERAAPRIGAFEVSYKLVNTTSGKQYGPIEVFSKIQSCCWPGASSILLKRIQEQLQGFLQVDMGGVMLYQHVRDRHATPQATPRAAAAAAGRVPAPHPSLALAVHCARPAQPPSPPGSTSCVCSPGSRFATSAGAGAISGLE